MRQQLLSGSRQAHRAGVDRDQRPEDVRRRLVRVLGGDARRTDRRTSQRQRQLGSSHRQRLALRRFDCFLPSQFCIKSRLCRCRYTHKLERSVNLDTFAS